MREPIKAHELEVSGWRHRLGRWLMSIRGRDSAAAVVGQRIKDGSSLSQRERRCIVAAGSVFAAIMLATYADGKDPIALVLGSLSAVVTLAMSVRAVQARHTDPLATSDHTGLTAEDEHLEQVLDESWWPRVRTALSSIAAGVLILTLAEDSFGAVLIVGAVALFVLPRSRAGIREAGVTMRGRWIERVYPWDRIAQVRLERWWPLTFRRLLVITDDGRTHTIYGIGARPFRSSKAVREFIDASKLRAAGQPVSSEVDRTSVRWSWIWKRFALVLGSIIVGFALLVLVAGLVELLL